MKVSPTVQDENGMTVLMHVIQNRKLNSYINTFTSDKFSINQEDNYGRTVLFYTLGNAPALWKLVESGIDINHKDHDGSNVLIFCCKNKKLQHIKYLLKQNIDVNIIDNEGRTADMYLAMNGFYTNANIKGSFSLFHSIMTKDYSTFLSLQKAGHDINYISVIKESALSFLLKYMYKNSDQSKSLEDIEEYLYHLIIIIDYRCIVLTEEMIKTETNTYNTMERERKEFSEKLRETNNINENKNKLLKKIMKIIY